MGRPLAASRRYGQRLWLRRLDEGDRRAGHGGHKCGLLRGCNVRRYQDGVGILCQAGRSLRRADRCDLVDSLKNE